MEIKNLDTFRRAVVLKTLLVTKNETFFVDTIVGFINDKNLEDFEIASYQNVLEKFNSNNSSAAIEILEGIKHNSLSEIFKSPCNKNWNSLIPTNNEGVKFCGDCKKNVFKVSTKLEYLKRSRLNQCVALSFPLNEKSILSPRCEMSFANSDFLLGSPRTIEYEK